MVTQRTANHSGWNVHLFDYFAANGTSLVGSANDPTNSGTATLFRIRRSANRPERVELPNNTLQVQVVTEGSQRDAETHTFRQQTGTIHPRTMGVNGRSLFSSLGSPPPLTGTGTGTGTATGTAIDTGTGTGTGTGLPSKSHPFVFPPSAC